MTAVQKRVGFSSNGKEFGFEVANAINYRNWEPGGEYTKLLKIKNVQLKARKIRYKLVVYLWFINFVVTIVIMKVLRCMNCYG